MHARIAPKTVAGILMCLVLVLFQVRAWAGDGVTVSEMYVVEAENNSMMAVVNVGNLQARQRLDFGDKNAYAQLHLPYPTEAIAGASAYIIRMGKDRASIRLNNISRPDGDLNIVLAHPDTGMLFAWRIPKQSAGEFKVPLSQTHDPRKVRDLPKLAAIKTTNFPIYPQPSIGTFGDVNSKQPHGGETANAIAQPEALNDVVPAPKAAENLRLVANSNAMKNLAQIAADIVPAYTIRQAGNVSLLIGPGRQKVSDRVVAMLSPQPDVDAWQFRQASYSPEYPADSGSVFGWTKTILVKINEDNTSLSDVSNQVRLDQSIPTDVVMAAIFAFNVNAFGNGDIYVLKKGSILRMPPRNYVEAMRSQPARVRELLLKAAKQL